MFLTFDVSKSPILLGLVVLAAITKRAQTPFSAWLPAAIAAPTPVRALVHSSTLVTAGVYLLIRFYPSLENFNLFPLSIIAILTSLAARARACYESDLKKIVALSTLSQLGFIICTLRFNLPLLTFFHLITHAFFKALIFVCVGKIIHENEGNQDLRTIGHLSSSLPISLTFINLSNLSLCGAPFLAGFFSKDAIIESLLSSALSPFLLLLVFLMVALSSLYSTRLLLRRIFINPNTPLKLLKERKLIFFSMLILGTFALSSGAGLS